MRRIATSLFVLALLAPEARAITTTALLDTLENTGFQYFWNEANASNGMIRDRSQPGSPASIAAIGFGLSTICTGVDRGWVTREAARTRVRTTLETLWNKPQGSGDAYIGRWGFFYHFLDMNTALRVWDSELSTIDSALLFAGVLDAGQYFDQPDTNEARIRFLADTLYRRAEWKLIKNLQPGLPMGWKPTTGFFGRWQGYNEAMIMYLLALGHPNPNKTIPASDWTYWCNTYSWGTHYGYSYVVFPPLFGHQYSHVWIDFRHIRDPYMQTKGIDYFENSRRATLAQRAYSIANTGHWVGYSDTLWGITACDDPFGYAAHGAPPWQNDNGTIAPTAAISSLPFAAPECLDVMWNFWNNYRNGPLWGPYGFRDAFNPTYTWWDTDYIGIDQGPIVLMIENFRTEAVWNRFMQIPYVQAGLAKAGFVPATTAVEEPAAKAALAASISPNPFTALAAVRFRLPEAASTRIEVFDLAGRRVARLLHRALPAGDHQVTLPGAGLASGVYRVRITSGDRVATWKAVRVE